MEESIAYEEKLKNIAFSKLILKVMEQKKNYGNYGKDNKENI